MDISRRRLMVGAGAMALSSLLPNPALARPRRQSLNVDSRVLEVRGKPAKVFSLLNQGGTPGLTLDPGQPFTVRVYNRSAASTVIHWHGQTPPNDQDGVPDLTQPPIKAGASYDYDFMPRPGTHWMHSHVGLQEQQLLAAPMIIRRPEDVAADRQEIVVMLHDFSFRSPEETLADLVAGKGAHGAMVMGVHNQEIPSADKAETQAQSGQVSDAHSESSMSMDMNMEGMAGMENMAGMEGMSGMVHLNDVEYDAYLANDRTLDDPEVIRIESGGRVLVRLINAASSTNFTVDLGELQGRAVAVDGNAIAPLAARRFPLAIAQRLDIEIDLPAGNGAWPVTAIREGAAARTGIVLATRNATIAKLAAEADEKTGPIDSMFEQRIRPATRSPAQTADRRLRIMLSEGPGVYDWGINFRMWPNHLPLEVRQGEYVTLTMGNPTSMAHPMHLHGAHFQVLALNGKRYAGAFRDTLLVPAKGMATIGFQTDNPGRWAFHCHNLYHMAKGMMTEVRYIA